MHILRSVLKTQFSWIHVLIGLYLVVGLFNLDRLPIAWNDEIQNLDPALVWHHTGQFCSPLWPNPGAEKTFLSYPPLIEAWHCLWLFVGQSPGWIRFPFLIFHVLTAILLYRFVLNQLSDFSINQTEDKKYSPQLIENLALLITALFLFDKATGEIARSVRVETLILFLILSFISLFPKSNNRNNITVTTALGLCLGALSIAHLYTWPLVITATLLLLNRLFQPPLKSTALIHGFTLLLGISAPIWAFWFLVKPEWNDLKAQLFMQAEDHSGTSIYSNLQGFFIGRFFPYTIEQPYTFFLHLFYWLASIRLLTHSFISAQTHFGKVPFFHVQNKMYRSFDTIFIPLLYLSFSLPTSLFLNPQHRYYPIQHLLGLLVIAVYLKNFNPQILWNPINHWMSIFKSKPSRPRPKSKIWKSLSPWISLIFFISLFAPWTLRNTVACLQRQERNPHTAINFLNKNLNSVPAGEILGEPIANYWLSQSPHPKNWKYGFEFYPQHFPFNPKIPRYFLSRVTPQQLPFLQVQDSLILTPQFDFTQKLGHTYNGFYLYKIPTALAWNRLTSPDILKITSGH